MLKKLLQVVLASCLWLSFNQSAIAFSTGATLPPDGIAMAIDGLIIRPVTLAATITGAAIFVVTLPFSAAGNNTSQAAESLVGMPYAYTFYRCLGCILVTKY